ncbi:T-lymphocyte activation antigen CD80 isoform X2 [Emydura macquarii macquarii]|uniref:T-lymphocyte activation antigen CD80 isoform X2 n=1 Tax=Emydura macquarii macquarii TaxID=1129001 RepID=UPI00352B408E
MEYKSSKKMGCMAGAELMLSGLTLKRWFWRGLFVLHFASLVFAQERKIRAKVGEKAILPCCYEIPSTESLHGYRVYWQTKTSEVVIAYTYGNLFEHKPELVNRTQMNQNNLTLSISPVELSDQDTYTCIVQGKESSTGPYKLCEVSVVLSVVADFSTPVLSADGQALCGSSEVTVTCSSHGGYPEPKVSGVLNNRTVNWQTKLSGTSPYNITATLQHNLTEDIALRCTIQYDGFEVSSDYILRKPEECNLSLTPPSHGVIIACMVLVCIFLVAIALLLKYVRCHASERLGCSHYLVSQDPAVGTEMKEGVRDDLREVTLEAASD